MSNIQHIKLLFIVAIVLKSLMAIGQCSSSSSWGSGNAPVSGTVTFSTCCYAGDYSTVNSCVAGTIYRSESSVATDYITIRFGSASGGTVIAFGTTPLVWTCPSSGTYYQIVHANSSCGTQSSCRSNMISFVPSCVTPTAAFTYDGPWQTGASCYVTGSALSVDGAEICAGAAGGAARFQATGSWMMIEYGFAASCVEFCFGYNTDPANTVKLEQSANGVTWTTVANPITTPAASGIGETRTYSINSTTRFLRWTQTNFVSGNNRVDLVKVYATTTITAQPSSVTGCSGSNYSFSVSASGAASYQWQVNTGSGWSNIGASGSNPTYSGYNTATLSLTGVVAGNNGWQYRCVVSGCSSVNSSAATLTVSAVTLPTVATNAASSVTATTATSGGNVTFDGCCAITERGVCYSATNNPPTISDSKVISAGTTGSFSVGLTGLSPSTTYYTRAYAINCMGISYGPVQMFVTSALSLGTVTATDSRGSAPTLTLNGPPNNCSTVGGLATGKIQVRNLGGSTLDSYIASETCFLITHSNTPAVYKNVWAKVTIPAGSSIRGLFFYSSVDGVSPLPASSTNLRAGCLNVFTGTTTCTPALVCGSKFDNVITSYSSSSPYIVTLGSERVDVTPGTTYYIEVWTLSASTDPNYNFDIYVVPVGARPPNDLCTSAEPFSTTSYNCNLGAYPSCNSYIPSCWFTLENSVFYTFTRPSGPSFQIEIDNMTCQGGESSMQTAIFNANTGNCITNLTAANEIDCHIFSGSYTYTITDALPAGSTYILWFDGNSGAACSWGISLLPVNFIDFDVSCNSDNVLFHWATESEEDNDFFLLESSKDGINFQTVGLVPGGGTVNKRSDYDYSVHYIPDAPLFYRLSQTDFDGKTTILKSVYYSHQQCNQSLFEIDMYPNPVEDVLSISLNISRHSYVDLHVIDVSGRIIVPVIRNSLESGVHLNKVAFEEMKAGLYFLSGSIDGEPIYRKFSKQ